MSLNGFTVKKEMSNNNSLYIFVFQESFTEEQFLEYLALLDKLLLDLGKPFSMLIDTSNVKNVPLKASVLLIQWMKKRKQELPGILIGSAVVVVSPAIAALINGAFKIHRPICPNKITTSYEKAYEFLYLQKNTIT